MLDLTGILFTSVMMLTVIVRAVKMDQLQPWFQVVKRKETSIRADQRRWKRGN